MKPTQKTKAAKAIRELRRMVMQETEVHCLTRAAYAMTHAVKLDLQYKGKMPKAKIVKAYEDDAQDSHQSPPVGVAHGITYKGGY